MCFVPAGVCFVPAGVDQALSASCHPISAIVLLLKAMGVDKVCVLLSVLTKHAAAPASYALRMT